MRLRPILLGIAILIFVILTFPTVVHLDINKVRLDMLGFACAFASFFVWPARTP